MQHATMPATATATACAPLLKRLRAAAVQLVLDHQARGKQPMSAPELEAQLKRDGAWPLRGVSTRLDRALKGEAHLFVLDVGSSVYYYATQVISARQRVVCDAAVAALEEHLPWEGWFRQGRRTLPIDDLAGALTHEHALAVTGEELQGALQADPRIVLGGDGKRSWAGLWRAGSLPLPQGVSSYKFNVAALVARRAGCSAAQQADRAMR